MSPPPTKYSCFATKVTRRLTNRQSVLQPLDRRAADKPEQRAGVELLEEEGLANLTLRAIALWTNIHGLATLRATRALDILGTPVLTPLVTHTVRVHLS